MGLVTNGQLLLLRGNLVIQIGDQRIFLLYTFNDIVVRVGKSAVHLLHPELAIGKLGLETTNLVTVLFQVAFVERVLGRVLRTESLQLLLDALLQGATEV